MCRLDGMAGVALRPSEFNCRVPKPVLKLVDRTQAGLIISGSRSRVAGQFGRILDVSKAAIKAANRDRGNLQAGVAKIENELDAVVGSPDWSR